MPGASMADGNGKAKGAPIMPIMAALAMAALYAGSTLAPGACAAVVAAADGRDALLLAPAE